MSGPETYVNKPRILQILQMLFLMGELHVLKDLVLSGESLVTFLFKPMDTPHMLFEFVEIRVCYWGSQANSTKRIFVLCSSCLWTSRAAADGA